MRAMDASRSLNRVGSELAIGGVRASCAAEMALRFQFRYRIQKHLYGNFDQLSVHVDHVITNRWSRNRNAWKHDRSFPTFSMWDTMKLFSLLFLSSIQSSPPSLSLSFIFASVFPPIDTHANIWRYVARAYTHLCFSGTLESTNTVGFIMRS